MHKSVGEIRLTAGSQVEMVEVDPIEWVCTKSLD